MQHERRSREWWRGTVARWRKSGLSAVEFAAIEHVSERTLRWWSSQLRRGTRAERGSKTSIVPLEIKLAPVARPSLIEIEVEGAVVRVASGTDLDYVCALVRRVRS